MTGRRLWLCVLILGGCSALATAEEAKKNVWANLDIELYGFIKADASYSDSRTYPGNYVVWVEAEDNMSTDPGVAAVDDDEFNLTANETRFGFKIKGPQTDKLAVSGQLEWDLYGSGAAENKAHLMLRHAFVQFDCLRTGWSLLAGQTWDVVAPLNPSTLNYSVLWYVGNIGYRRPQIRLQNTFDLGGVNLIVQGAVARTIGSSYDDPLIAKQTGADAGYPNIQARTALSFGGTTVGISGHYGEEEHDYIGSRKEAHVRTWSGCVDWTVPVAPGVLIKGEAHTGSDISQFLGGIGQGIQSGTGGTRNVKGVRSSGGWMAATLGPWTDWCFNLGYGMEEVARADLVAGQRRSNSCAFANAIYSVTKHSSVGVEVSRWDTNYITTGANGKKDGDAWVGQLSYKYTF